MIRSVNGDDCEAIAEIYNDYVVNSTATFETEPITAEEMRGRISSIYPAFPYFVYEEDGKIRGYCYAHAWKERAAYSKTLETTVYIADKYRGRGIGKILVSVLLMNVANVDMKCWWLVLPPKTKRAVRCI